MGRRGLPDLCWPLDHPKWRALRADESGWSLLPRAPGPDPLFVAQIAVVFEWGRLLVIRLTWPAHGWRRHGLSHRRFFLLRAHQHPGLWALLRAHLAKARRSFWLGG